MQWPLSSDEWHELLQPLPSHADRAAVQQAIEDAVREYLESKSRDEQLEALWQSIASVARAPRVKDYFCLILRLKDFPLDPLAEAIVHHAEAIAQISRPPNKILAARHLADSRLKSRLSQAWTDLGLAKMPISDNGPFVDALTARLLPPGLGGEGVKKFVRRERKRRAMVWSLKAREGVVMKIDGSKVHLIDLTGQLVLRP